MTRAFSEWLDLFGKPAVGHPPDLETAYRIMTLLYRFGAWKPGDFIVDVGAGNGAYAALLASEKIRYLGLEPIRECVDFCQRVFAPYPHLQFVHVDWQNDEYNPTGTVRPEEFRIPVEDGAVDLAIFVSIFTHLQRIELCHHYLQETYRALRHGGKAWVTWFRHPPNERSASAARSAFPEWEIIEAIKPFTPVFTLRGLTPAYHDQWQMFLEKRVPPGQSD